MLHPANIPVAAGKKIEKTEKKPSFSVNAGIKFSAAMVPASIKLHFFFVMISRIRHIHYHKHTISITSKQVFL